MKLESKDAEVREKFSTFTLFMGNMCYEVKKECVVPMTSYAPTKVFDYWEHVLPSLVLTVSKVSQLNYNKVLNLQH